MRLSIITVGKPALAYARMGCDEYLQRLQHYGGVDWQVVKPAAHGEVIGKMMELSSGSHRILLDERGKALSTQDWATAFGQWENQSLKRLSFLIGPADGFRPEDRKKADAVWSLSALTMQHELALLVLLEQIYRVQTFRKGEPYHRVGSE